MSTRPIAVVGAGIVGCLVAREIISRLAPAIAAAAADQLDLS